MTQVNYQTHPENQSYTPNSMVITVDFNKQNETSTSTLPKLKTNINNLSNLPEKEKINHAVNPLTAEDIERAKEYFLTKEERYSANNLRDYTLFIVGINVWLRISDLVKFQIHHLFDQEGNMVDSFVIHEQKTSKITEVVINTPAKEAIVNLLNTKDNWDAEDYLFQNYRTKEPLTRNAAWRIMKKAEEALGLDYSIGTHTLRKTGASQAIQKNPDNNTVLYMVQERLNHSRPEITMRYVKQHRKIMSDFIENCGI